MVIQTKGGRWSCSLATNGHGSDAGAGPAEEKLKPPAPSRPEVHLGDGWGGALELYLHDSACREVVPSNQSESVIIVWSCIFEGQIADMKPQRVKDCELGKFLWSDTCCCMIWELARIPHAESQNVTNLIGIIIHEDLKLETSWIHHRSPRKHQLGEEHYQVAESSHAKFVMAGSSLVADLILLFLNLFLAFAPATAAKTHEEMCTRTAGHTWHNTWKFSLLTWIAFDHFDHPDLFDLRQSPFAPSKEKNVRHAHVSLQQVGSLGLNLTLQQLGMRGKYIRGEVDCGGGLWQHNLSSLKWFRRFLKHSKHEGLRSLEKMCKTRSWLHCWVEQLTYDVLPSRLEYLVGKHRSHDQNPSSASLILETDMML